MSVRISEHPTRGLVIDIIVRLPDGTEHRERRNSPVPSESGAKRWAINRERHLLLHGIEAKKAAVPTLEEFAPRWMREYAKANGNKPSTLDSKERILRLHLLPVLGQRRLDEIGEAEVAKVKVELDGATSKTVAGVLSVLSTLLKTAERWGVIARAPRIVLPRFARPEMAFYDFSEYDQLLVGAARAGAMQLAFVLLAGDAGLRRGELVGLEHADVGPLEVTVRRSVWQGTVGLPKGGKIRRVPMTTRLKAALVAVRHLRGKRLLWQASGAAVTHTTLQSWLEVASKRAGLPESRDIHKLRHTFCSHLAMRGAPARAIQELAGHADLSTTLRYMHLSPAAKDSAIRLLEPHPAGAGVEQTGEKT